MIHYYKLKHQKKCDNAGGKVDYSQDDGDHYYDVEN